MSAHDTHDHDGTLSALDHALLRRCDEVAASVVAPDEIRRGCTSWSSCVDEVSDSPLHVRLLELLIPRQIALP